MTFKAPDLNPRVIAKDLECTVARPVIKENVPLDPGIVVAKEEAEHLHFVPRDCVQMNAHFAMINVCNFLVFRQFPAWARAR